MSKREVALSSEKLSKLIVKGMQEKKAIDIRVLDLRKIKNAVADFFVVCSGSSDTHMTGIADSVEHEVFKGDKQNPWHKEDNNNKSWVLLDYVDVVTHIFSNEARTFYGIEDLWADAEMLEVKEPAVTN